MPNRKPVSITLNNCKSIIYISAALICCLALIMTTTASAAPLIVKAGRSPIPQEGESIPKPFDAQRLMPLESERDPAPSPGEIVPWYMAPKHLGRIITIEGHVERANNIGGLTFLNFTNDMSKDFIVICFSDMYDTAPGGDPANYEGQTLQITGRVILYRGAPQIALYDGDIKVVGKHPTPLPANFIFPNIVPPPTIMEAKAPLAKNAIPWEAAYQHVGQKITTQGKVVAAKDLGGLTILNFTHDWRGKFSVVVFSDAYDQVPGGNPENAYLGQTIQVTGLVSTHKKAPQIAVRNAEQIKIVGVDGQIEEPLNPVLGEGVIPWNEAKHHVGKEVTVAGTVVVSKDIGSRCFLNFTSDFRGKFTIMIPKKAYSAFKGGKPWVSLKGKQIEVTGKVSAFRGTPQMEVTRANQIVVK
ncbi:aspartyl-tRNA synthetase [Poriferisphaera corsica]|uniref:Aspartyl-tRNA synthetase n=2 Tax=Poriferisphaera corsica TaxID=2528020 RepID=A0A517YY44_9BACT|nr:aspartyl-tRNA synthetase [Poriferisphaera corsica]